MDKHELRDLYIKETGNPFPDDIAKYADWLEEKFTPTNTGSPKFLNEILCAFSGKTISTKVRNQIVDRFVEKLRAGARER